MPTLAEQLRDAMRDYRYADDSGDQVARGKAYARMKAIDERIRRGGK